MIDIDALKRDKRPQSSTLVHALIDRLEAAEKEIAMKERVIDSLATVIKRLDAQCDAAEKSDAVSIAMYRKARDERDNLRAENAALVDDMNLLRNNNTALRAKVEQMERQEPVVEVQWAAGIPNGILDFISTDGYLPKLGDKLYALPGAKGEEK